MDRWRIATSRGKTYRQRQSYDLGSRYRANGRGYFGSDEYEYSHTIPALFIAQFFELLGAKQVTDILGAIDHFGRGRYPEIVDALEKAKGAMPIEFWSRH